MTLVDSNGMTMVVFWLQKLQFLLHCCCIVGKIIITIGHRHSSDKGQY